MASDEGSRAHDVPRWALDVWLWQELECDHPLAHWLARQAKAFVRTGDEPVTVTCRPWHLRHDGETDLLVRVAYAERPIDIHVTLRVDGLDPPAGGGGEHLASARGAHARSLLIAPSGSLARASHLRRMFDGVLSLGALADRLDSGPEGDSRQRWVAERIREMERRPRVGVSTPYLERWARELARLARGYGLHPKSGGFIRSDHSDGGAARFITDEQPIPGPGSPRLVYRLGAPSRWPTLIDLAWHTPSPELRARIVDVALRDGFEVAEGRTELYVRMHGGERFGSLTIQRPFDEQIPEARSMLAFARRLLEWWDGAGDSIAEDLGSSGELVGSDADPSPTGPSGGESR